MAVMCVPMPPCFFGLPLRQMMLPFIGPLPVSSQNRAITSCFLQGAEKVAIPPVPASTICGRFLSNGSSIPLQAHGLEWIFGPQTLEFLHAGKESERNSPPVAGTG